MSFQAASKAVEAAKDASAALSVPTTPRGRPPPPPVIPTTWLEPHEQRIAFLSTFGLIECVKVWDILGSYISLNPEPTWSSAIRVQSFTTAAGWAIFELAVFFLLSLLRIPLLSPTGGKLVQLAIGIILWNIACWAVASPSTFAVSLNFFGPPALGVEWYLSWWPILKRMIWGGQDHISGVHRVRLLPFSTATLNPLSLTYCLPPNADSPVYIPIVFNNSAPNEVSYFIRSLESGHAEFKSVAGSTLRRPSSKPLAITDIDEDDEDDTVDPLAMILSSNVDASRIPSVKPADSLALVPRKLTKSENMLFIAVDRPSVVTLKSVSDKRGDRFHIAPHREAVIIECPYGGDFISEDKGKVVKKASKRVPAEQRCIGDEEVIQFQVRGVGAMKVGWKKRSQGGVEQGTIEGIESDAEEAVHQEESALALVRRDKVARTHTVPLRIKHDASGVYTVSLTSVSDSLHNSYTPSGPSSEWSFDVHSRPIASFECPQTLHILRDATASIPVVISSQDGSNSLGQVEVSYEYTLADASQGGDTIRTTHKRAAVQVSQAGTYTLVDVGGKCNGRVIEPSSCRVEVIPLPTMQTSVRTLHECAMDVGVTVTFDFTGVPPFNIDYTEQRNGGRIQHRKHKFSSPHGEIVLLPDQEGEYTYQLVNLGDRHYNSLPLSEPPIKQIIHPLANVDLAIPAGRRNQRLYACSGDEITIDVEAKGRAPLSLNYHITSGGKSENLTTSIPHGRSSVTVPVPKALAAGSGNKGQFSVSLLAITDGNGCTRRLNPAPSYEVQVDRERPTARLAKGERVVLVEGDTVKAPLRLTGTGPWHVSYVGPNDEARQVTMRDANGALSFQDQGVYRLTGIRDNNCPGDVIDPTASFEIAYKPRPAVQIVPSHSLRPERDAFVHKGLCEEEEDQVAFRFQGEAPFELAYRHTRGGQTSRHTLKSAQAIGILHLSTEPGSHRYDILELRDANYAEPVSLAITHDVNSRPSVTFSKPNTKTLCLDSTLKTDAKLRFEGKAPFNVQLSVRKPASSHVETYDLTIDEHEWTLELLHVVKDIGRHEVSITSLSDASGCEWTIHERDRLITGVNVVESARIVPVGTERDLCVGERIEFELQGTAPWSIEYLWLGKAHRITSSASKFSRYAEEKGVFAITSVALKDDQCKRKVTDLERRIHPLPSVRIQDGVADLREGDDPAAFAVSFTGTPPFAFTYTRSEAGQGDRGRGKVVETQTVSDIWTDEYLISSSLPGDYQVVSVSDRYCRYPPLKGGKGG